MKRLKEGDSYSFKVERVTLAPDKSEYYVLTGPGSMKYLLPLGRYGHYGIREGDLLYCRVDRINCRGEIFLEPPNPYYSEGKDYSFRVSGFEKRVDTAGEEVDVIIVTDRFGHSNPVAAPESFGLPEPGSELQLTVLKISKGRLFLGHGSAIRIDTCLDYGKRYEFTVVKTARDINGQECFVIRDKNGHNHTIPKRYYEHYGLKEGSKFRGKVIRLRSDGEMIIEPDNPWYKKGSVMEFRIDKVVESPVNGLFTWFLSDIFGFLHCIEMKEKPEKESIALRIGGIRKGKPLLRPL